MSATATKTSITLKGSAAIISEYLKFGLNSILFQRGIGPGKSFIGEDHYGLTIFMCTDPKIRDYLCFTLDQVEEWLKMDQLERVSLTIKKESTYEIIECWDFSVFSEDVLKGGDLLKVTSDKDFKKIQAQIRDVMRQIAATVSYLPTLECKCVFTVRIRLREHLDTMPNNWFWYDEKEVGIRDAVTVKLKTFSTGLQKMETAVSYKVNEE